MTREDAIRYLENCSIYQQPESNYRNALEMAIEALSAEPCGDYISRAQAIKAMDELENEDIEAYGCSIPEGFDGERARQAICLLPSIQPKPKTGHWKKLNVGYGCSECSLATNKSGVDFYRFCLNCGAKMESEVPT